MCTKRGPKKQIAPMKNQSKTRHRGFDIKNEPIPILIIIPIWMRQPSNHFDIRRNSKLCRWL